MSGNARSLRSLRCLGISELRLCARGARGRLGCSSDRVPAPPRRWQVPYGGWESHGLFPGPRLRGGKQPAGLGTHLLPEKDPTAAQGELGVWPERARLRAAAAWLAPARSQSDPPKRAPGQGQGHGASLARGALGAAAAASAQRLLLHSLLPGGVGQRPRGKLRPLALLRSVPAPSPVLG